MRPCLFAVSLVFLPAAVTAHDLWLQPSVFQVAPNVPLGATFLVGHGAHRERWNNNDRIVAMKSHFAGASVDLRRALRAGKVDLQTRFGTAGLHVLAMESNHSFSELPARQFDAYALEEGLVRIIGARRRAGTAAGPGRERYSRRAKSLILVGNPSTPILTSATRPIGLKLEVVPERNPFALGASRVLPVYVVYNGRRLPNATVKLTNLNNDVKPMTVATTDKMGRAKFRIPQNGKWLINVVWSEPVSGNPRFDYETIFSSLTFATTTR